MKMRTLRRLSQQAPRHATRRRRYLDPANVTTEPDLGPPPEVVFDRMTGPYGGRDEET